jgi:hypothetical protein
MLKINNDPRIAYGEFPDDRFERIVANFHVVDPAVLDVDLGQLSRQAHQEAMHTLSTPVGSLAMSPTVKLIF